MTWSYRRARRPLGVTAAAGLTLLAAACGSTAASSSSPASPAAPASTPASASSPASTPAGSASAVATASAAATPAATPSATATSTGSAGTGTGSATGPAPCATSALSVRVGASQGAAGSSYVELDFTNTSRARCSLYGYPGVSFTAAAAGSAAAIGAAATRTSTPPAGLVTLAPGAVLRVAVAGNYPAAACHLVTAHYLRVYPPDERTPLYVGYTSPTCSSASSPVLSVAVVQPGAGDAS